MSRRYVVRPGECIYSIAARHNWPWRTVWDHPDNAALRSRRKDPGVLLAGDEVAIPDRTAKTVTAATGGAHAFVVQRAPVQLRLVVQRDETPMADEAYTLEVEGASQRGRTDAHGLLVAPVPASARRVTLRIRDLVYQLELGGLDPIEEAAGVQARLKNLGLFDGDVDGRPGPDTREAVADFQALCGIEPTGDLDDTTRDRLLAATREAPGGAAAPPAPPAPPPPPPAEAAASEGDPTDEEEEFPEFELQQVRDATD